MTVRPIIGVDGEGIGRKPHRYVYLAASDETGQKLGSVTKPEGLDSEDCLSFLVSLAGPGKHARASIFGFSIGYDIGRWLFGLPAEELWRLMRPEHRGLTWSKNDPRRNRSKARRSVYVRGSRSGAVFKLDWLRSRFSVQRVDDTEWTKPREGSKRKRQRKTIGPRVTVWDCWSFFGTSFVRALDAWKVGTPAQRARIGEMKDQRSTFDAEMLDRIGDYCDEECQLLGKLMRKLVTAHEREGLKLRSFFGAGSSGAAMLTKWNVKRCIAEPPEAMREPIACAEHAGHFETSRIGPIEKPVFEADICSAYPYAMSQLPCLACGSWERVQGRGLDEAIESATLALVRVSYKRKAKCQAWGAFPYRLKNGGLVYPLGASDVWTWRPEYLAAQKIANVTAREAWVYRTDCKCRPFAELPAMYRRRVELGASEAGLSVKLALNSGFGKTAQSVGSSPFRSWIWAGMITSTTRALLVDAIASARDPWSVVMVATDGIYSTERLTLPKPVDTATAGLVGPDGKAKGALGSWEEKEHARGIFIARPGLYWDLDAGAEVQVRARGIGRKTIAEHVPRIVSHWRKHARRGRRPVVPPYEMVVTRFVGPKSGVLRHPGKGGKLGPAKRDKDYGEWVDRPVHLTFEAGPKRCDITHDHRLVPWLDALSAPHAGPSSAPYGPAIGLPAMVSTDTAGLKQIEEETYDTGDDES